MRSSRLLALVMALPRGGLVPAGELAARLEVSVRTIYRDVAALEAAGVPVRTQAGPAGGVGLVEGWRSPVEGLTTDEARALLLGGPGADLGLGAVLATARSKVRSGLPPAVRAQLDVVAERFLLDTSGWFRDPPPELLADVAAAVWAGRRLDLSYARGGDVRRRRVDPLGLVLKAGRWYLVATHRDRPRTYRIDRVTAVRVRDDLVRRPPGFDLETSWQQAAARFDADLRRLDVRLTLPIERAATLRAAVPGPLTARIIDAAAPAAGHLTLDLPMEGEDAAFAQLVGVPGVEVASPARLRERLAAHGRDLAARHT